MTTIADRVRAVISSHLGAAVEEVTPESKLVDDLGADSLDQVEIVMGLEDEFEIEIPDDDAEKISTVQQVIDYITGKVPKAEA